MYKLFMDYDVYEYNKTKYYIFLDGTLSLENLLNINKTIKSANPKQLIQFLIDNAKLIGGFSNGVYYGCEDYKNIKYFIKGGLYDKDKII